MTVVARRFASRPKRTSTETWEAIALVVAGDDGEALLEFNKVRGVVASLISEEYMINHPIVVIASAGPRVRAYCLYDENALVDDDVNENPLSFSPTKEAEWNVFLPCGKEDFESMNRKLESRSAHFHAYDLTQDFQEDAKENKAVNDSGNEFHINEEEFRKL